MLGSYGQDLNPLSVTSSEALGGLTSCNFATFAPVLQVGFIDFATRFESELGGRTSKKERRATVRGAQVDRNSLPDMAGGRRGLAR
jgi:hypothetical protein